MRGTQSSPCWIGWKLRIIPAHAGNTPSWPPRAGTRADHPRACGEHHTRVAIKRVDDGSSPRMRGTHRQAVLVMWWLRIIPAHAGNTPGELELPVERSDHPRACGEHCHLTRPSAVIRGSSPRMRGTLGNAASGMKKERIIPAHAGNTLLALAIPGCVRIIPAHAGNTQVAYPISKIRPDHPRACGEHTSFCRRPTMGVGSSPRMRGTPIGTGGKLPLARIIPAHAGNTPAWTGRRKQNADHPRACGEHLRAMRDDEATYGSSPRMRGTLQHAAGGNHRPRIIPAHAGNT